MGTYHGKGGVVEYDGTAIGSVKGWSYNESVELANITAMGDTRQAYSPGIPDGSGSLTCVMSIISGTGADAGQADVDIGDQITLSLYPAGNTSTYTKFAGSVVINSIDRSSDLSSAGEFVIGFQGKLTEGVVSP